MQIVITIFAIYGLLFAIKETDGPWGVMNWFRRKLISNKYVGVFFFNLLQCPFCCGCWCSLAVYLLTSEHIKLTDAIIWFLAGGAICLFFDGILSRLHRE